MSSLKTDPVNRTLTEDHQGSFQLAQEWIEQLRATERGELWWENLIDALVSLKEPIMPLLVEQLSDEDRAVVLGVAKAIERIARSLQREAEGLPTLS